MKDAGILEGDYVVVHPQDTASDGDVVVALLGEEATVKRFFREPDHIRLQPENETMEPIRSKEVKVLGRVVGPAQERLSGRRRTRERGAASAAPPAPGGSRRATLAVQVRQPRRPSAFEESPDITGQGGREIDPGKPAGKCHRNKPPTSAVPRERRAGKGEMVR